MAYFSDSHGYNEFNGNMFHREPKPFNSYGYTHVVPRCNICGFEGHASAECQQRYSTPNCFGMNFAQQHGSYHNSYSDGWSPNQNVAFRDNSPPISQFSPSYQMQGFRCGEESQHYSQQYEAPNYASRFHQGQPQFSTFAEQTPWMAEVKEQQQDALEQIKSQLEHLKACLAQVKAQEPQFLPQKAVPVELYDPPQAQAPTNDFDDEEKLSLLCLEYNWSAEDDPVRPVIITEMKKIKNGRDLVEELKEIEKRMKLSNVASSQLELELSAPVVLLETCVGTMPTHVPEQTSEVATEAAAVEQGIEAEIEEEESAQILEAQDSQLVCISEEHAAMEDNEVEILEDMHIVIQECDETGLSNPLDDMLASEFYTIVSHYMIPLLDVELNHQLPNSDHAHYTIDFAHDRIHVPHNPYVKILLENVCFDESYVSKEYYGFHEYDALLAAPYHSTHVLYSYTYMIGYSIDNIVGENPITSASCSLCVYTFRLPLVYQSLMPKMVRVDIPWDPGGYKAW